MHAAILRMLVLDDGVAHPRLKLAVVGSWIEQPQSVASRGNQSLRGVQELIERNGTNTFTLFCERRYERVPTHRLDQELHPRFHASLAFAVTIEETDDRRREVQDFLSGQE